MRDWSSYLLLSLTESCQEFRVIFNTGGKLRRIFAIIDRKRVLLLIDSTGLEQFVDYSALVEDSLKPIA